MEIRVFPCDVEQLGRSLTFGARAATVCLDAAREQQSACGHSLKREAKNSMNAYLGDQRFDVVRLEDEQFGSRRALHRFGHRVGSRTTMPSSVVTRSASRRSRIARGGAGLPPVPMVVHFEAVRECRISRQSPEARREAFHQGVASLQDNIDAVR